MEGLEFLKQLAQELHWNIYESDLADVIYSLKVGGPTKKKGQRNFHLGYVTNQIVGRSLDLPEVLARIRESAIDFSGLGASSYTLFRATVVEGNTATALIVGQDIAPLKPKAPNDKAILEDQTCGLNGEGCLHLFPNPERTLHGVRFIICPDPTASENRELSSGELALRIITNISRAGFLPGEAMAQLARLSESVIGLECAPSELPRLIQENCFEA